MGEDVSGHSVDSGTVDTTNGDATMPEEPIQARFKPGFAWGLAAGAVGVVAIIVVGNIVQTGMMIRTTAVNQFGSTPIDNAGLMPSVVISPVRAGQDWFSVDSSGTGVLEGWTDGAGGAGDFDIPKSNGYVDVTAVGSVDGVKVKHSASVFVTPKTKVFIGAKRVAAEDVFRDDLVGERKLTVEFHRFGQDLVADTIRASAEVNENPMY